MSLFKNIPPNPGGNGGATVGQPAAGGVATTGVANGVTPATTNQPPSSPIAGVALAPAPDPLSLAQLQAVVPAHLKNMVTPGLVQQLNQISTDPLMCEAIRNNFMSFTSVMKEGKFKLEDYLHAVTFVSYRLMGNNNKTAYFLTFPSRHAALVARGTTEKDISAYVSAYSKNKLVNLIAEQSMVPTWVLNQDVYQEAINTQVEIMRDPAISPKVRSDAANSILTHLKKPEGKDFQLSVDVKDSSGINELREALAGMAQVQQGMLQNGTPIKDVTHSVIIEGEVNCDSDPG